MKHLQLMKIYLKEANRFSVFFLTLLLVLPFGNDVPSHFKYTIFFFIHSFLENL